MDRWSWTISIPGLPSMVPAARAFVRAFLGTHPLVTDAELICSEYVTNAIRHTASGEGGGAIHVTVAATARTVRIEVTDHGQGPRQPAGPAPDAHPAPAGDAVHPAPPTEPTPGVPWPGPVRGPNAAAADEESGRGLLIVDFLAARWGHYGLADGQVTAWAELGEPGESETGPSG